MQIGEIAMNSVFAWFQGIFAAFAASPLVAQLKTDVTSVEAEITALAPGIENAIFAAGASAALGAATGGSSVSTVLGAVASAVEAQAKASSTQLSSIAIASITATIAGNAHSAAAAGVVVATPGSAG
jgi:hypothetical protein